jgi:hypothetical protein
MVGLPPGYFDPSRYVTAISYGRFSSAQQASGQSRQRQSEALAATLERFGWRLLDAYFDHGVSAGRGKHRAVGALGRLLRRVREREIPTPCVLVVETFDRLSREELTIAQEQFLSLVNLGMAVYTTMDGQGYDQRSLNANPGGLFTSIGMMLGASGVYKVMADRAEKGWIKRRDKATAMCPGWLRLNADGSGYDLVDGAQETLERIFEEAQYLGLDKLAARLNQARVPTFKTWNHKNTRRIWYDKHLRRIIAGRAVRGEVEVGKYVWKTQRATVDGEVIEYETSERMPTGVRLKPYPEVIAEDVWQRTNAALQDRATGKGRKGTGFSNLFQGLARCYYCGGTMNLKSSPRSDGGKPYQYYRCDTRHRRGQSLCHNAHVYDYGFVETSILRLIAQSALQPEAGRNIKAATLRRQIAELRADIDGLRQQREWMNNLLREAARQRRSATDIRPSDLEQLDQIRAFNTERDAKLADTAKLEKQLAQATAEEPQFAHYAHVKEIIEQMPHLPDAERYALRAKINTGMKRFLEKITFEEDGTVVLWWPTPRVGPRHIWPLLIRDGELSLTPTMIQRRLEREAAQEIERQELGVQPRMRKKKGGGIEWVWPKKQTR